MIQSLVRMMPDLHKTLLLASLQTNADDGSPSVQEIALTSEHAQFRQKHVERVRQATQVGTQRKRKREEGEDSSKGGGGGGEQDAESN